VFYGGVEELVSDVNRQLPLDRFDVTPVGPVLRVLTTAFGALGRTVDLPGDRDASRRPGEPDGEIIAGGAVSAGNAGLSRS
jgi:hypothetical protein